MPDPTDAERDRRRSLTFAQAEGHEAIPAPLKPHELSPMLRNMMWATIHTILERNTVSVEYGSPRLKEPLYSSLKAFHVAFMLRPIDEYTGTAKSWTSILKQLFLEADYVKFYGSIEFLSRVWKADCPEYCDRMAATLERFQAGYRLYERHYLFPVGSREEAETIARAVTDLRDVGREGARRHLGAAADSYNAGDYAGAVREAVHAVESVARWIEPAADTLGPAISKLSQAGKIHPALKTGLGNLYGYSCQEEGIRHALVEKGAPSVSADEAQFMIGACAAFISYLVNQARAAGIPPKSA